MKLPNAENAFVDIDKLRNYCLRQTHRRGRNEARLFATLVGLTAGDATLLRDAILAAVLVREAVPGEEDSFGMQEMSSKIDMHHLVVPRQAETSCLVIFIHHFPGVFDNFANVSSITNNRKPLQSVTSLSP